MPMLESDGARIHYEIQGTGERTLLLLHGWCDSSRVFGRIAPMLAKDFRVITLDWRGHGRSSAGGADFGSDDLVNDAEALLDALEIEQCSIVAVAHAGWPALELKARQPERVDRIAVMDWIVLSPPPEFMGALKALQDPTAWRSVREKLFSIWLGGTNDAWVSEHFESVMRPYGFEAWARAGREIAASYETYGSPLDRIADLKADVLHLYSQPKNPDYFAGQRAFAKDYPRFHAIRLDGATHFPLLEEPEVTVSSITEYLRG